MFGWLLGRLPIVLLAVSGGNNYSFQDSRLQYGVELYEEGQSFTSKGNYKEACDSFMQGIFVGRSTVQKLQEENETNDETADDPNEALEWLISSYIACGEARIQLGDLKTARSDAWAACMFSQNKNLKALECMLTVCKNTDDIFGEVQTLKQILSLLTTTTIDAKKANDDTTNKAVKVSDIQKRIVTLEKEMEKRFKQ